MQETGIAEGRAAPAFVAVMGGSGEGAARMDAGVPGMHDPAIDAVEAGDMGILGLGPRHVGRISLPALEASLRDHGMERGAEPDAEGRVVARTRAAQQLCHRDPAAEGGGVDRREDDMGKRLIVTSAGSGAVVSGVGAAGTRPSKSCRARR